MLVFCLHATLYQYCTHKSFVADANDLSLSARFVIRFADYCIMLDGAEMTCVVLFPGAPVREVLVGSRPFLYCPF